MMHQVKIPHGGFKDGHDGVKITQMEVAAGKEYDDCTEIFVRGKCIQYGAEVRFAGMTTIREGRDTPDADLVVPDNDDTDFKERLAVAIHLCLDHCDEGAGPDRFSVGAEMARICGDEY